jgi:uncharacterized protein YndB with AHSA1/START domain
MTITADASSTTQVDRIYIRATPQAIRDGLTRSEWTERYGHAGLVDYDLRPGGAFKVRATEPFMAASAAQGNDPPEVIIDGEAMEADPPRRLVTTFRMLMDPDVAAEPATRITDEIREGQYGL